MTPYINPSFRDRQKPVALLPGAVAPDVIEAQAREVAPAPVKRRDNRHAAFCAILAFPVAFAIMAAAFGDMRLCAILCLVGMAIALIGLYMLDGPV